MIQLVFRMPNLYNYSDKPIQGHDLWYSEKGMDESLFIPRPHLPRPPLHRTPRLPPPGQSGPPPPLHLQVHLLLPRPPRPQKSPQGRRSPHLPPLLRIPPHPRLPEHQPLPLHLALHLPPHLPPHHFLHVWNSFRSPCSWSTNRWHASSSHATSSHHLAHHLLHVWVRQHGGGHVHQGWVVQ